MMNKYVSILSVFLCSNFLLGVAQSYAAQRFEISVVNEAGSDISLTRSTWHLGGFTAEDYMIPEHYTGEFNVTVPLNKEGTLSFNYATATTACRFQAEWGLRRVGGWLFPSYETVYAARGISIGQFGAACDASIVRDPSGGGFTLMTNIK